MFSRVIIKFSEWYREKLCEKKLIVLVSHEGSQWLGTRCKIFGNCACFRFLKNAVSNINQEPLKKPHLKWKTFFDQETLNPNNQKY